MTSLVAVFQQGLRGPSLVMLSKDPRAFGMRLEGQVQRTCASFGRAKQDLRRVVSCWES